MPEWLKAFIVISGKSGQVLRKLNASTSRKKLSSAFGPVVVNFIRHQYRRKLMTWSATANLILRPLWDQIKG